MRRSFVCRLGVLLALALFLTGCSDKPAPMPSPSASPVITSAQAKQAFETLYPGFKAKSAREHDGTWVIQGSSVEDQGWSGARPFRVRAPIRIDQPGVVTALVDGVEWSGTKNLAALEQKYVAAQWKHQAQVLGASLNTFLSAHEDDKPAEPLGSPTPVDGQFTARIVAADAAKRTVTVDRFQVFYGDAAYRAAAEDDPQNTSLGSAFYTRNLIPERTVLRVDNHAVVTRYYSQDGSPPMASTRGMVTAIDVADFFREYQSDRVFREMLRGGGATIIMSRGKIIAIVGKSTP